MISAEVVITAQFGDLDPMNVVWHGTYVRYLEQARSALMDKIGYNYLEMNESGFLWPIVDLRLKYVRPIRLLQRVAVEAAIAEFENRLKVDYICRDFATREVLNKSSTIQVAVEAKTLEMCLECPTALIDRVRALL
jgi:acyl-CoA thioester hydrolase